MNVTEIIVAILSFLGGLFACKILIKNNKSNNKSSNWFSSNNKTEQSNKN